MPHVQIDVLGFQVMFTAEEAEQLRTGAVHISDLVTDEQVLPHLARVTEQDVAEANEGYGVLLRHDWSENPVSISALPPPSRPKQRRPQPQ
ncbi:MAG: hypothetical protein ACXVEF_31630 [Polyangiales bacterium]